MILPWVLLFTLLSIHAENFKEAPHKVWIPAIQQSVQRNVLKPKPKHKSEPITKILDHNIGMPKETFDDTLSNHNTGIKGLKKGPPERSERKPLDDLHSSPMTLKKKLAYMEKIKKYPRSGKIKSSSRGRYTIQSSAQTIV